MAHASFFARPARFAHKTPRHPGKRPAQLSACVGVSLLLIGSIVAAAPAAARCLPVAELPAHPPAQLALLGATPPGIAGDPTLQERPWRSARIQRAAERSFSDRGPALPQGTVELTFLGHSSFLIRTAAQATAITDYNGYIRASFAPDIVTMNRAHNSHYTDTVEPGVTHVLRGWMENGVKPSYDVRVRDLHVTNVLTNIRDDAVVGSGFAGNSIFIFESAGLCVVHLGHLHHRLIPSHAARVGTADVLLAPVDDGMTIPHAVLVQVIDDFRPAVVVPMHYGFGEALERFLALMRGRQFVIQFVEGRSARFTKPTLPIRPTVMVLQRTAD